MVVVEVISMMMEADARHGVCVHGVECVGGENAHRHEYGDAGMEERW